MAIRTTPSHDFNHYCLPQETRALSMLFNFPSQTMMWNPQETHDYCQLVSAITGAARLLAIGGEENSKLYLDVKQFVSQAEIPVTLAERIDKQKVSERPLEYRLLHAVKEVLQTVRDESPEFSLETQMKLMQEALDKELIYIPPNDVFIFALSTYLLSDSREKMVQWRRERGTRILTESDIMLYRNIDFYKRRTEINEYWNRKILPTLELPSFARVR